MWREHSAGSIGAAASNTECAFDEAVLFCMRRIRGWRAPPNWEPCQWREEMEGHSLAAACDAQAEYDASRGVPFGAFVYRRVMARLLTRYRQEWNYARHCVCELGTEDECCPECAAQPAPQYCDLVEAVASLSARQRWLVDQIFWRERTESAVAGVLGLSQRAVSKRKQAVLGVLRRWLEDRENISKVAVLKRGVRGN